MIKCAYINILETSTVTLAAGAEDSDFPLYRLYDRDTGKPFKAASAVTTEVLVDQGPTGNLSVDRLIIAAGHNLDTETLDIMHSDDDAVYTPAIAQWVQSGAGLIDKSWSPETHRYWKFIITSPSSAPQVGELFLTQTYQWQRNPQQRGAGPLESAFNVERRETAGGGDRFLVHGPSKRRRTYRQPNCGEAQRDSMLALNNGWGGFRPFWLYDHDGAWIYGRLVKPLELKAESHGRYSFGFDFKEVI